MVGSTQDCQPPPSLGSAQDGMSLVSLVAKVLEQPMPPTIGGPVEEGPTHRIYGVPFAMLAARPTDSRLRSRARIDGGAERGSFSYACNHLTGNRGGEQEGLTRAVYMDNWCPHHLTASWTALIREAKKTTTAAKRPQGAGDSDDNDVLRRSFSRSRAPTQLQMSRYLPCLPTWLLPPAPPPGLTRSHSALLVGGILACIASTLTSM